MLSPLYVQYPTRKSPFGSQNEVIASAVSGRQQSEISGKLMKASTPL